MVPPFVIREKPLSVPYCRVPRHDVNVAMVGPRASIALRERASFVAHSLILELGPWLGHGHARRCSCTDR